MRCWMGRRPRIESVEQYKHADLGDAVLSAMEASKVYVISSQRFSLHNSRYAHPESPKRIQSVLKGLETAAFAGRLVFEDGALPPFGAVEAVHRTSYISQLYRSCKRGGTHMGSRETYINRMSWDVASLACGAVCRAIDLTVERCARIFCAVRPPGHHAHSHRAGGFCLLNNSAVAARYAHVRYGVRRVLILDWDAHHGDGTQEIFYGDDQVFYLSIHQRRLYPFTGLASERGEGRGLGYNLNVPVSAGAGDAEYEAIFVSEVQDVFAQYRPELVIISAGFDAHVEDEVSELCVSTRMFGEMTRLVCQFAEAYGAHSVVSVLEGGYNVPLLTESVLSHVDSLSRA